MIKPVVFMGVILLLIVSAGVYNIERRVESLRSELKAINQQLIKDKERMHVLRAEWSYLNQPERIDTMAQEHLELNAMDISQVKIIEDIPLQPVMVSQR